MKHAHNNQGFSLMEVMIALAIFSISIVALYGIQTMTISHNYVSSRITTAATWATEKIEEIISLKYSEVTDINGDGVGGLGNTAANADGHVTSPDGVYSLSWNVAGTDDATGGYPMPNTKTVRVIVTTQRTGTGSTVELEFIKHNG